MRAAEVIGAPDFLCEEDCLGCLPLSRVTLSSGTFPMRYELVWLRSACFLHDCFSVTSCILYTLPCRTKVKPGVHAFSDGTITDWRIKLLFGRCDEIMIVIVLTCLMTSPGGSSSHTSLIRCWILTRTLDVLQHPWQRPIKAAEFAFEKTKKHMLAFK